MKQQILIFIVLIISSNSSFSQKIKKDSISLNNLFLINRNYGDSIVLRWGTNDAPLWYDANENGYVLEKFTLKDGKLIKVEAFTKSPIKPLSLNEWKEKYTKYEGPIGAAMGLLYGKQKNVPPLDFKNPGVDDLLTQYNNDQFILSMAMFVSSISPEAAYGMGLRYVDKDINKNNDYAYRIFALTKTKGIKSDTAFTYVKGKELSKPNYLPSFNVTSLDKTVKFEWKIDPSDNKFIAYYFEFSEDGGKTYFRKNKLPQIINPKNEILKNEFVFVDSLSKNYFTFYYRIIGINSFGDESLPTEPIKVIGRDLTPPSLAQIVKGDNIKLKCNKIVWEKKVMEADFSGYIIGVGNNFNGPFYPINKKVLSKTTTSFIDSSADPNIDHYYIVGVLDTAGNATNSMPFFVQMKDTVPPIAPIPLKSEINNQGCVQVKWKLGKEPDILGYMVYRSYSPEHVFNAITKGYLVDTVFYDTINVKTLSRKVYYKVVAFDTHKNNSPYSKIISIGIPDNIPPQPCVFTNYSLTDSSVLLFWNPSSSEDIKYLNLLKSETDKDSVITIRLNGKSTKYLDKDVESGIEYQYNLISIDSSGLESNISFPINVKLYKNSIDLISLEASLGESKKYVQLKWNVNVNINGNIEVYRKLKNEDKLFQIANVEYKLGTYKDFKIDPNSDYLYKIRFVIDKNKNTQSKVSKFVEIKI